MVVPHPGVDSHALLTRAPVSPGPKPWITFDLHVLSLPPAFVLSQDQTLKLTCPFARPDPKAPDARQDSSRFPTQTRKKVHGTSEIRVRVRVPSGIQPEAGARTPPPAHPFHSTNDVKQPGIETVGLAPRSPRTRLPGSRCPPLLGIDPTRRRDTQTDRVLLLRRDKCHMFGAAFLEMSTASYKTHSPSTALYICRRRGLVHT